jgi:hypothetical protein
MQPVLLPVKRPHSSPAETSSSYKPPAYGQPGQRQQQRIEVSAADFDRATEQAESAAGTAAFPERFYSLPGSSMPPGGAAASNAESAAAQSSLQEQQQQQQHAAEPRGEEQQDSDFEQFEDVGDSSLYAASSSAATAAEDNDAASATGSSGEDKQLQQQQQQEMPFSEDQLQELIAGSLNRQYWEPIHDGVGSVRDVYSIRGPNYLKDRKKIPAGAHAHILTYV